MVYYTKFWTFREYHLWKTFDYGLTLPDWPALGLAIKWMGFSFDHSVQAIIVLQEYPI